MDNKETIANLKGLVKDFCDERDWAQFHNPKDLAIGIATEASELLQIFRFKSEKDIQELMESTKREKVEAEIADIFYFVLRFAQMNDIDLATAIKEKIDKNAQKYPVEKAKGCNKKYDEYND